MNVRHLRHARQRGVTLIVVLILLIASVFLGVSAAVIALQTEKASRGDRDRQIAFQAAEAALIDAQLDIRTANTAGGRQLEMNSGSALGFPPPEQAGTCNDSGNPAGFGLCRPPAAAAQGTWPTVNLSAESVSVPYGRFTGQQFPVGQPGLPARQPRYVIELMSFNQPGYQTGSTFAYRITAIGFGTSADTQVVLQAFYRKEQ